MSDIVTGKYKKNNMTKKEKSEQKSILSFITKD